MAAVATDTKQGFTKALKGHVSIRFINVPYIYIIRNLRVATSRKEINVV